MRATLLLTAPMILVACVSRTNVEDLQLVFGPNDITFEQRELAVDLNGDELPERLILLADKRRGLNLSSDAASLAAAGLCVDGFAVFDGRQCDVPVIYQYADYDGYCLRLDELDGQLLLVSDGGRDHVQHVWGWWHYPDDWPIDGWEARWRAWDEQEQVWGKWHTAPLISSWSGK